MSELQTLKTAIHEIAHAKLHDIDLNAPKDEQQPRVDRRTREVEAKASPPFASIMDLIRRTTLSAM